MQEQWKLSRAWGVANVLIVHRLSDLAASVTGSESRALAEGLLADCSTRIMLRQERPAWPNGDLLGLTDVEIATIAKLPKGRALWRLRGGRSSSSSSGTPARPSCSTPTPGCRRDASYSGSRPDPQRPEPTDSRPLRPCKSPVLPLYMPADSRSCWQPPMDRLPWIRSSRCYASPSHLLGLSAFHLPHPQPGGLLADRLRAFVCRRGLAPASPAIGSGLPSSAEPPTESKSVAALGLGLATRADVGGGGRPPSGRTPGRSSAALATGGLALVRSGGSSEAPGDANAGHRSKIR